MAALVTAKAGYFTYAIPRGTYSTQKQDVRTVATAALLLAGPDLSETEVGVFTRYVFEKGRDFAARGSAQGVQVAPATRGQWLSVPLHIAAAKVLTLSLPPPRRQRRPRRLLPPNAGRLQRPNASRLKGPDTFWVSSAVSAQGASLQPHTNYGPQHPAARAYLPATRCDNRCFRARYERGFERVGFSSHACAPRHQGFSKRSPSALCR